MKPNRRKSEDVDYSNSQASVCTSFSNSNSCSSSTYYRPTRRLPTSLCLTLKHALTHFTTLTPIQSYIENNGLVQAQHFRQPAARTTPLLALIKYPRPLVLDSRHSLAHLLTFRCMKPIPRARSQPQTPPRRPHLHSQTWPSVHTTGQRYH